jgi:hypothetical protein
MSATGDGDQSTSVKRAVSGLMLQIYVNWAISGFHILTADAVFRMASKRFHLQFFIQHPENTSLVLKPLVEEFCSINWPSYSSMRETDPRLTAVNFLKQHASKLPIIQGSFLQGHHKGDSFVKQPYLKVNTMHVELCRVHALLEAMPDVRVAIRAIKTKLRNGDQNPDIEVETNVVFDAFDSREVGFKLFTEILAIKRKISYDKNSTSSPAKKARIREVTDRVCISSATVKSVEPSSSALGLVNEYGDDDGEEGATSSQTQDYYSDDEECEAEESLSQEAFQQEDSSLTVEDSFALAEYQKTVQLGECR